jgi:hypothetical protein
MGKRPLPITIIGWIFIAFGSIGFLSSFLPPIGSLNALSPAEIQTHWMVHVARIAGVVSGVFMLKGMNWARWLLVVWIVFHLIVSVLHSLMELLMHAVIFAVVLYFIFRPPSSAYFRSSITESPPIPE